MSSIVEKFCIFDLDENNETINNKKITSLATG